MKRRQFLSITAGIAIMPKFAFAEDGTMVGFYDFALGDTQMTVISGGYMDLPTASLGTNADPALVKAMLADAGLNPDINHMELNHIVIRKGDAVILVDAGTGGRFMEAHSGQTMSNLEAAGIDPSSITHVAFTHAHPDHIWGARDDFDEPFLPDIPYYIGEAEVTYWRQDGLAEKLEGMGPQFAVGAVNTFDAIDAQLEQVGNDFEIVSGVRMIDTPGHTLGHMSLIVDTSEGPLLVAGDAITHAVMNFLHPQWTQDSDSDGELTVATRLRLLDMTVADKMMVLGYHLPFPGLGFVEKTADAYKFTPIA